jgi:hypothetical protein
MKAILLFLSSLLTFVSVCAKTESNDIDYATDQCRRYSFQVETKKAAITGIFITKENAEIITGSMVNEFGISAIDFVYTKKTDKIKLLHVVSFLNKWYIKMVLKKDLIFCIHTLYDMPVSQKNKYIVSKQGECVSIDNSKRHLKYVFCPLIVSEDNDTEESTI